MADNVKNNKLLKCSLPEPNHNHPWLMITHGKEFQIQTFYSISKGLYIEKRVPEIQNKQVSQASYGWLLLIDNYELDCCLMNPKTMEKIELPKVSERGRYRCALSKPPTQLNCHILLKGAKSILFCRVGDNKFIQRSIYIQGALMMAFTNFEGKIHAWMGEERGLVTVDFGTEDLVLKNLVTKDGKQCRIPCRKLSPRDAPLFEDHLIESCGELLLVHMICCSTHWEQVASFRIFKIDVVQKDCKELSSIGDRAIFLSKFGSMATLCSSKETGVEKDSIYYINPMTNDKFLYVYHIQNGGEVTLVPRRSVDSVRSLKSWIMII